MSGFDSYSSYVASDLFWLDKMPVDWTVKRIKEVVLELDQGWSPNAASWPAEPNEYGVLKLSAISNNLFHELENKAIASEEVPSKVLLAEKGRVLITRSNTPKLVGETCLVRKNTYAKLIVPDLVFSLGLDLKQLDPSYFSYLINSHSFSDLKTVSARGLNDSMVKISQGTVNNWVICLPPRKTQQSIANYLDTKLADINSAVHILKKKIELYEKIKQSVIFECVTVGLHPDSSMSDNTSEWTEQIPEHWEMLPVRKILNNISVKNKNGLEDNYLSLVANIGVIPYEEKGKLGNNKPENLEKCKVVSRGDLVLNTMNFGIGSFGLSKHKGVCSSVYLVLRPFKNCNGEYLHRIFQTKHFQKYVSSYGKGILDIRMAIKWESLKNIEIPIPPEKEQLEISSYIDKKETEINKVIKNIERQLFCLKELSVSLADEIITGKVKLFHEKDKAA